MSINVVVKPGKYVLAVSGGVDSVVLLDILSKKPQIELIVAHFDHGIRESSLKDAEFVKKLSGFYGYIFELGIGNLGLNASEQTARTARYNFLNEISKKYQARSIITAHHQDDEIETAIINIIRGTGRKGLTPMRNNKKVLRPLLKTSKSEILNYATKNKIKWVEDESNKDEEILRNYIRNKIMPFFPSSSSERKKMIDSLGKTEILNKTIDNSVEELLESIKIDNSIIKNRFIELPYDVSKEVLIKWLEQNNVKNLDKKTINRLVAAIKTSKKGKIHDILGGKVIIITEKEIVLENRGV